MSEDIGGNKITAIGMLTFSDGSTEPVDDVTFAPYADETSGMIKALNPVVTTTDKALVSGESIGVEDLFTATDPSGLTVDKLEFINTNSADGGHFILNGTTQNTNQTIEIGRAQLPQLAYQAGAGGDMIDVRVSNGATWSSWSDLSITHLQFIAPGATLEIAGASTATITFSASTGTFQLDLSSDFGGNVLNFGGLDHLDFTDITFGDGTTFRFLPNADHSGGTIEASDGTHTSRFGLVGTGSMTALIDLRDEHGGTLIQLSAPNHSIGAG